MLTKLVTVDEIFQKYLNQKNNVKTSQSYQSYNNLTYDCNLTIISICSILSHNFSVIWSFEEFLLWLHFYQPQSLKVLHIMWSILKIWLNIHRILWRLHKHYKVLVSRFHVRRNDHELCWLNINRYFSITLGAWISRTEQNVFSNLICWAIPSMMV